MMLKGPFYKMDDETENALLKLVVACKEIDLGNAGFKYYGLKEYGDVYFRIDEEPKFWEATVNFRKGGNRYYDYYTIDENGLHYDKSEIKKLKKR
jgi:hypothetical protein